MNILKIFLFSFISYFLLISFIAWDINPSNWGSGLRYVMVALSVFTGIGMSAISSVTKSITNNK